MINFKRILVAVNHSSIASIVFERALNLARQNRSRLMVLHCLADPVESGISPQPMAAFELYPADPNFSELFYSQTLQAEHQAEAWLQELRQKAVLFDIPTDYQCHFGDPSTTICHIARQWNADAIVLGRHDRSAIAELFSGSVSNYVVHHATCSVLVIKDGGALSMDL